ncbi:MAG: hypothetical protein R3277_06355 [Brumimicrobium sp.]|nr:hypothetical protein [Brumimicrobium sp.]
MGNPFKIYLSIFLLSFIGCSEKEKDQEYVFLLTCYEDFYLNYDVDLNQELNQFENQLVAEGHLKNTSGDAYMDLLRYLETNSYFSPPLKMDDFENAVLYKTPEDLINCAHSIFGIDSILVAKTAFFRAERKIGELLNSSEEVSMNDIFGVYTRELSAEELEKPYVKQAIQVMLYRWYFKSKYDREISIPAEKKDSIF